MRLFFDLQIQKYYLILKCLKFVLYSLLISSVLHDMRRHIWYNFNPLKFVKTCCITQDMVIGPYALEKNTLLLGVVFYVNLIMMFRSSKYLLIFCLLVLSITKRRALKSQTIIMDVYISIQNKEVRVLKLCYQVHTYLGLLCHLDELTLL